LVDWNAAFTLSHLCKSLSGRRIAKPICHCHHGANGICLLTLPSGHLLPLPDFYAVVNPSKATHSPHLSGAKNQDKGIRIIRIWTCSHAVRVGMVNGFIVRQWTLEINVDFPTPKKRFSGTFYDPLHLAATVEALFPSSLLMSVEIVCFLAYSRALE